MTKYERHVVSLELLICRVIVVEKFKD